MGRIKSTMIKRTSRQLLEQNKEFSNGFEQDKSMLRGTDLPSKRIRNKIAGYIARLVKQKETESAKKAQEPIASEISEDEE